MMGQQIMAGVKVLDLSRVLAGPWCTQSLADMGATVYKIVRLGTGDEMRQSPPFLKDAEGVAGNDTTSYVCVNLGQTHLTTGKLPQRAGNGSLLFAPANCFPCLEGHIFIQIGNDMQWARLCKCLGKQDWLKDPQYAKNVQRMVHKQELDLLLADITSGWDKQAMAELLGAAGVPCGPVNNLAQALAHPQVQHCGIRVALDHPVYGNLDVIRSPLRFSKTLVEQRIPPALGADTAQVLAAELGVGAAQFAQMTQAGLV